MQGCEEPTIDERSLFEGLSEPQREAVAHTDGPLLILAGPGSGKTRVVTRRAAHLACTVARPREILAITFTNKAAREMQERIDMLGVADGMTVCTFHALCAKLLRWYHDRAGVSRNFTIFDREDRRKLVKQAVEACGLSTDHWAPAMVERDIGLAKNDMVTPEAYTEWAPTWREREIARIYAQYEKLLAEMAGLDFDDLLMRMALLLDRDVELRDELEDRYRYVLIDEYQDTNASQYRIARRLTEKRRNLCATGDPDQSIYGWRGANIRNILSFEHDYPEAKVVRLEQNYRSTQRILAAADRLIAGNVDRKEKTLWTRNAVGTAVRVFECASGHAEADMIAQQIARDTRSGTPPGEIAVFYRINSLSRVIEEALLAQGIQYQIVRGVEFYNRKEIKDVLAYLRVLINPADEVSLLRIINVPPRGIGATTIRRLVSHAQGGERSLYDTIVHGDDLADWGRLADKVRDFAALLEQLQSILNRPAPEALAHVISQSGLRAHYHEATRADEAPARNLDELITAAAEYQATHPDALLLDWLEHTALVSDVDGMRDEAGTVTLMTLHAAKGLEFSVVYVIGMEDGLLPFRRQDENACNVEEERRLLFVGMTRAKERLTLSHARFRMQRGSSERTARSPFLDELPRNEIEWDQVGISPAHGPSDGQTGRLPDDIEEWTIGTLVRHEVRGVGRIASIDRGAKRTHVKVQFRDGSDQTWVLEFARLTRVDFDEIGDLEDLEG